MRCCLYGDDWYFHARVISGGGWVVLWWGGQHAGKKIPLCLQFRAVRFGISRGRPLGNKFNKYTVEKDSWAISSGRCTVGRRPPKSTTGVETPKSHYFQRNFVTKKDLIPLRVLQLASETPLFSLHAKYSPNMCF